MVLNLLTQHTTTNVRNYIELTSEPTKQFILALERAWVFNNSLSIPYWIDKIGQELMNKITYALTQKDSNWLSINGSAKFASIKLSTLAIAKYTTTSERDNYRKSIKIRQYSLKCNTEESSSLLTSTPSGVKDIGLVRTGFEYAAKQQFSFDIPMMIKYEDYITEQLVKSITKMKERFSFVEDDILNYGEISKWLFAYYTANPKARYNMEANISDSRGRSIYTGLKRVFNPIADKNARALLISNKYTMITTKDYSKLKDIYRFIAELLGIKSNRWATKALAGKAAYLRRELPKHIDHEHIWLERIYSRLDTLFTNDIVKWDIPIEIDMTASVAGITGLLFGDSRLMDKTNLINKDSLKDFWDVADVPRVGVKAIGTPISYGSNQSFKQLLAKKNIELSKEQMNAIKQEFKSGAFSIVRQSKDYWTMFGNITTPNYKANIWNDEFTIEVNKFKTIDSKLNVYTYWDPSINKFRTTMIHKPMRLPDYKRFSLYYTTCLVHNLDSQLLNNTLVKLMNTNEWAIGIHDAILCLPGSTARVEYTKQLQDLFDNRQTIIKQYQQTLNITSTKAAIAFGKILLSVDKVANDTVIEQSAMK